MGHQGTGALGFEANERRLTMRTFAQKPRQLSRLHLPSLRYPVGHTLGKAVR